MPDASPRPNPTAPSWRRILRGVLFGAAIIAPLFPLLDLRVGFLRDWPIHVWFVDYYAEYFRQHGDLPTVIHLGRTAGLAVPVFYGILLYPVLGIGSALVGTALALRLAFAAMLVVQFAALLYAGRRIFGHRSLAVTVAVSVIWSTYSLTNLYNRGALAEYFATGFYATALALGAAAVFAPGVNRRFLGWLTGFFLLLAVGTHPPTAVMAAVFLVVLGLALAIGWRRGRLALGKRDAALLAAGLMLGAVVLAPWIYANLGPGRKLAVAQNHEGFQFRPDHCDTIWGRLAPFPYDAASVDDGVNTMGTPYLEAPINVVLLGILLWNLELCRRGLRRPRAESANPDSPAREILAAAAGWFLFLTVFSLSPWLAGHFEFLAPYIQYVYRLVTHCNAGLLVAVFASGALVAARDGYRRFRRQTQVVVGVGLTVAILGLAIKVQHGAATEAWEEGRTTSLLGGQADIARAYEVPSLVRELTPEEARGSSTLYFAVNAPGLPFGETGALQLNMSQAGWMQTNAMVFPWLKLERDGKVLRPDELARVGPVLAVHLSPGVHVLRLIWQPDPAWLVLYRLSQAAFVLILVLTAAWAAQQLRQPLALASERAADHAP